MFDQHNTRPEEHIEYQNYAPLTLHRMRKKELSRAPSYVDRPVSYLDPQRLLRGQTSTMDVVHHSKSAGDSVCERYPLKNEMMSPSTSKYHAQEELGAFNNNQDSYSYEQHMEAAAAAARHQQHQLSLYDNVPQDSQHVMQNMDTSVNSNQQVNRCGREEYEHRYQQNAQSTPQNYGTPKSILRKSPFSRQSSTRYPGDDQPTSSYYTDVHPQSSYQHQQPRDVAVNEHYAAQSNTSSAVPEVYLRRKTNAEGQSSLDKRPETWHIGRTKTFTGNRNMMNTPGTISSIIQAQQPQQQQHHLQQQQLQQQQHNQQQQQEFHQHMQQQHIRQRHEQEQQQFQQHIQQQLQHQPQQHQQRLQQQQVHPQQQQKQSQQQQQNQEQQYHQQQHHQQQHQQEQKMHQFHQQQQHTPASGHVHNAGPGSKDHQQSSPALRRLKKKKVNFANSPRPKSMGDELAHKERSAIQHVKSIVKEFQTFSYSQSADMDEHKENVHNFLSVFNPLRNSNQYFQHNNAEVYRAATSHQDVGPCSSGYNQGRDQAFSEQQRQDPEEEEVNLIEL